MTDRDSHRAGDPDPRRVLELLAQVQEEQRRGVNQRRAVLGAVVLMFVVFGLFVWHRVETFETDRFVVSLQEQAATRVWPATARELDAIGKDAVPAISEAMQAEMSALLPRLSERARSEAETFQLNVSEMMRASLDKHFLAEFQEHREVLRDELPAFSSESPLYDDLVRRLRASARGWAQDQLDRIFEDHLKVLQSINETVQQLMAEARTEVEAGREQSAEDVLFLLVEIFNARINEEG